LSVLKKTFLLLALFAIALLLFLSRPVNPTPGDMENPRIPATEIPLRPGAPPSVIDRANRPASNPALATTKEENLAEGVVQGFVLNNANQEPITRSEIFFLPPSAAPVWEPQFAAGTATTSDTGWFSLPLPAGSYRVWITLPSSGYLSPYPQTIRLTDVVVPSNSSSTVTLLVNEGRTLSGVFHVEDISPPVSTLRVTLLQEGAKDDIQATTMIVKNARHGGSGRTFPEDMTKEQDNAPTPAAATDGAFRMTGIAPSTYLLRFSLITAPEDPLLYWEYPVDLTLDDLDLGEFSARAKEMKRAAKDYLPEPPVGK